LGATIGVVGHAADVITSPPVDAMTFNPSWLMGYDVLYIDLYGEPGDSSLYRKVGDRMEPALDVATVRETDLCGAVVIATACYLPQTPFLDAFLAAGARGVIGGAGYNWGDDDQPIGAQKLAKHVIARLEWGDTPEEALKRAKGSLSMSLERLFWREATEDALQFALYEREGDGRRNTV